MYTCVDFPSSVQKSQKDRGIVFVIPGPSTHRGSKNVIPPFLMKTSYEYDTFDQ